MTDEKHNKIHLIGIGGTGMGGLAGLLLEAGHEVRGSDGPLYPPMSTMLADLGVPVMEGFSPRNLDWGPDVVVVGNICSEDHPEAAAARELAEAGAARVESFPSLLGRLFLEQRQVVVAAGTHGKTTTSSMMAHLLDAAGLEPGFLIGGIPGNLGGSGHRLGRAPHFVVEGDEYDCAYFDKRPKFVHYRPRTVILTGVEFDHADIYPTMADVEGAFAMLVERVPPEGRILVCAESAAAVALCRAARCPVETYSVRGAEADWQGEVGPAEAGRPRRMVVRRAGALQVELRAPVLGLHNMENILGVAAAGLGLGLAPAQVAAGLGGFAGVMRRQEVKGRPGGVTVVDDFAHHPTAVRETLRGLRADLPAGGKLWAAFEPRSATSKRRVFQDAFAEALGEADAVLLARLHAPEKVPEEQRLDPARVVADLRGRGVPAHLEDGPEPMLARLVAEVSPGDLVAVMSSGGFGGLPARLVEALGARFGRGRAG